MLEAGRSIRDVARDTGVPKSTVARYMRSHTGWRGEGGAAAATTALDREAQRLLRELDGLVDPKHPPKTRPAQEARELAERIGDRLLMRAIEQVPDDARIEMAAILRRVRQAQLDAEIALVEAERARLIPAPTYADGGHTVTVPAGRTGIEVVPAGPAPVEERAQPAAAGVQEPERTAAVVVRTGR